MAVVLLGENRVAEQKAEQVIVGVWSNLDTILWERPGFKSAVAYSVSIRVCNQASFSFSMTALPGLAFV